MHRVIVAIAIVAFGKISGQATSPERSRGPVPSARGGEAGSHGNSPAGHYSKTSAEPPRFTDPNRVAKLRSAFPEIDRLMSEFAVRSHVPGIAYGIVLDGEIVHTGATGTRDVALEGMTTMTTMKAPVGADTVFRIASMTKSFTALSILKLRDEGKLSLDDPAERYVPELAGLVYPTTDSPRITVRHLLSHAEGFPEDNPWGDRQLAVTDEQMGEMLRRGIPFSNPPGLAYEYSNYGFAILGRIVSRVSGMPYRDYVATNILKPLGLSTTTLDPGAVPDGRIAHGYRWEDGTWKEEPPLADGAFGAMGGMLTSIRDLGRYVAFMMSAWPPRDGADQGPVRRASLREMQQVWRPAPASVTRNPPTSAIQLSAGGYGFGLRVSQTCALRHIVAHSGGLPGFGSHMRWLPEHGVGVIALGNLTYTSWGAVIDAAVDALAKTGGLQARAPQPSPALAEARDAVARLIGTGWDDRLADSIVADNFFLDQSKERRRRELDDLRGRVGACRVDGDFEIENALRGQWTMTCERGALRVAITLAPTMPPRVQFLGVRPTSAPVAAPTCPQ
jgi:CubicO group peptidase (beta-lactamase class C family)